MPELLERIAQRLISDPKFIPWDPSMPREQAAYAVCRASLGLSMFGGEDDEAPEEMADAEITRRIRATRANLALAGEIGGPTFRKTFDLAKIGENFVNGDQVFDLTRRDMDEMVRNFTDFRRLVPVYLVEDHPAFQSGYRSSGPADGWLERMWVERDKLKVALNLHGQAATGVMNDDYRGVSLAAFEGDDQHGVPAGWILDHVLLTNIPYFNDLNADIAARASAATPSGYVYLTSRQGGRPMAPKTAAAHPTEEEKKKLQEDEDEKIRLQEEEEAKKKKLQEDEDKKKREMAVHPDDEKKELKSKVSALETENAKINLAMKTRADSEASRDKARQVRALIVKGRTSGRLLPAELDGLDEELLAPESGSEEDDKLLKWFTENKKFEGNLHTLQYATKRSVPMVVLDGDTSSGHKSETTLTASQQLDIRKRGHDPELVASMGRGATLRDFQEKKQVLDLKNKKTA